jgi:tetratricopeptide (TPR) repeat protein
LDITRFLFDRAKGWEQESQFDRAIQELEKVKVVLEQKSGPDRPFLKIEAFLHEKLGDLYSKKHDYENALRQYQKDLEISTALQVLRLKKFEFICISYSRLCLHYRHRMNWPGLTRWATSGYA